MNHRGKDPKKVGHGVYFFNPHGGYPTTKPGFLHAYNKNPGYVNPIRERRMMMGPKYRNIVQRLLIEAFFTFISAIVFSYTFGTGLGGVVARGLVTTALVYLQFRRSGAFFNPSLVLATLVSCYDGKLGRYTQERLWTALLYLIAILIGAVIGFGLVFLITGFSTPDSPLQLVMNLPSSIVIDLIVIFTYCLIYLGATYSDLGMSYKGMPNHFYGIAIGFGYIGLGIAFESITGGVLNQVNAFVTNIWRGIATLDPLFIGTGFLYLLIHSLAALAAGFLFKAFTITMDRDKKMKYYK